MIDKSVSKRLAVQCNKVHIEDEEFFAFAERFAKACCDVQREHDIQKLQSRYMGDNNREDMEVKRCVEMLKKQ